MYKWLSPWILIFFTACWGSSSSAPDASVIAVDSPDVDAPPAEGPNKVTVTTGVPLFIRYRDGNGPWQPAKAVGDDYEIGVTSDYELVIVCRNTPSGTQATLFKRTFADGPSLYWYCLDGGPVPGGITVDGSVVQPGVVFMQHEASGTTSPWNFSLDVYPTTHDLIVIAGHRIEIRRNLDVTATMHVGTINLLQTGTAMTAKPLTINSASDETVHSEYTLSLDNDYALVSTPGSTAYVAPDAVLAPGDVQFLDVYATTDTTFRIGGTMFSGTETTFQLMPRLTGITFTQADGVVTASWGQLPAVYKTATVTLQSKGSGPNVVQSVRATPKWIAAKGASQLSWDAEPSGFDAAWRTNLAAPHDRTFAASQGGPVAYWTGVVERH